LLLKLKSFGEKYIQAKNIELYGFYGFNDVFLLFFSCSNFKIFPNGKAKHEIQLVVVVVKRELVAIFITACSGSIVVSKLKKHIVVVLPVVYTAHMEYSVQNNNTRIVLTPNSTEGLRCKFVAMMDRSYDLLNACQMFFQNTCFLGAATLC
jgi:hypothetical protein